MKRVGQFTAAGNDPENRRAARDGGFIAFKHQRAGAFRHDETVAIFRERLGRSLRRIVLGRQRRQQRKPDQGFRIDRAVGRDAQRGVGFAAADRLDAELDGGGAGGAGGRKRNRRSLGAERFGKMTRHRAEHETMMKLRELSAAADAQQVVDSRSPVCRRRVRLPAVAATRPRQARPQETAVPENRPCGRCPTARGLLRWRYRRAVR